LEKREILLSYQESNHDYPADHPAALTSYRIGYPGSSSTSSVIVIIVATAAVVVVVIIITTTVAD